jgi:hypothetical protein
VPVCPGSSAVAGATVQATAANIVLGGVFLIGVALLFAEGTDATSYLAAAAAMIGVPPLAVAASFPATQGSGSPSCPMGSPPARPRGLAGDL